MSESIKQNVKDLLGELPGGVELVAAAKTMTPKEVLEAVAAGVKIIGENYVQEAQEAYQAVGNKARWHFIGHLQSNKVKKAVQIFDLIETIDSVGLAEEVDKRCGEIDKVIEILVEVNSGKEEQKFGVMAEDAIALIRIIAQLKNIKVVGLMTMGPFTGDPEEARPYFIETKKIFEKIKEENIPNVQMKYLSMGMTNSYKVAIEEGANLVRIGTKIFGERH